MSVGAVAERTERPALVRFKRVAVEDKAASIRENKYVGKDVDYALTTPPYSKDVHEEKVTTWLARLDADVRGHRMPAEWADRYREQYRRWTLGQEMPLNGTAIRGWGVISPAQQEMLIRVNILTVEDLASINDEGARRLGMGALELKMKAKGWLATLNDRGPLTMRIAALETENEALKAIVDSQAAMIEALKSASGQALAATGISANELLDDTPEDEAPKAKRK